MKRDAWDWKSFAIGFLLALSLLVGIGAYVGDKPRYQGFASGESIFIVDTHDGQIWKGSARVIGSWMKFTQTRYRKSQ